MNDLDDLALVREARRGHVAALDEIMRRHQRTVRLFLRRLSADAARADDLAQDTFLTAFDRLDTFRGEATLAAWLCGIAFRKHQTSLRSEARRRAREAIDEAPAKAQPDLQLDLKAAFAALPLEQRAAAALCIAAEMPHAEAALALGVPLGTLKSRVAAAKKALAQTLEHYR